MSLRYILFLMLFTGVSICYGRKEFPIRTVVIDAGHGGKDPGAIGPGHISEKDIALSVALKFGEYIEKSFPEIKVIYTRKTDEFLELHERADIANKNKADLFVAIHCNSSPNNDIYGTSTYVLGLHRTEANLEVAKRENSVILLEEDRAKNYEFDPNSAEGHIIMSMKQNAFLDQSIDMASKIENQYEDRVKRKSLGVRQAGFYVLYKTTMPSLLSEIGFVSNPDEEKFLNSAKGQDAIAEALFTAFKQYKAGVEIASAREDNNGKDKTPDTKKETTKPDATGEVKKELPVVTAPVDSDFVVLSTGKKIRKPTENTGGGGKLNEPVKPVAIAPVTVTKRDTIVKNDTVVIHQEVPVKIENAANNTEAKTEVKEPEAKMPEPKTQVEDKPMEAVKEPVKKAEPVKEEIKKEEPKKEEVRKEEPKKEELKKEEVKKEEPKKPEPIKAQPVKTEKTEVVAPTVIAKTPVAKPVKPEVKKEEPVVVKKVTPPTGNSGAGVVIFKVQLFALKGDLKPVEHDKAVKLFKEFSNEQLPSGITRYYGGKTSNYAEARKLLSTAVSNGYQGAFIVGLKDGKRLTMDEINALEGR